MQKCEKKKRVRRPEITEERRAVLASMAYQDYLKTPEWYRRRAVVLKFAGNRCQVCNSEKQPLHIHHRSYQHRGTEPISDLICLCDECHSLFHRNRRLA